MKYKAFVLSWRRVSDISSIPEKVLYVFGDGAVPYYVGKAAKFLVRYSAGYHHLINAFIKRGGFVYYAPVDSRWNHIDDFENALIRQWKPIFNRKKRDCLFQYHGKKPWKKA